MTASANRRKIMVFNPRLGGHNDTYIIHFLRYWCAHKPPANLYLVVSPNFLEKYPRLVQEIKDNHQEDVTLCPITKAEFHCHITAKTLKQGWIDWQLFCRYAKKFNVNHFVTMYLDFFTFSLALRLPAPCDLSGIYFRPSLHYHDYSWYKPSPKDLLKNFIKTWMLRCWILHPRLKGIFSLDPLSVTKLQQQNNRLKVFALPDPVAIYPGTKQEAAALRRDLGIEPHRRVFLMFGILAEIKGIFQLLEALKLLPSNAAAKTCLLLIGPGKCEAPMMTQVEKLLATTPIQIIRHNQFVVDHQVQPYFELADVVLTPYLKHIGMSSVLVRAAAAEKPVLSSDYGLINEIVRRNKLGITLDATQPQALAEGLMAFLNGNPERMFDVNSARRFARENDATRYGQVLCENILMLCR